MFNFGTDQEKALRRSFPDTKDLAGSAMKTLDDYESYALKRLEVISESSTATQEQRITALATILEHVREAHRPSPLKGFGDNKRSEDAS